MNLRKGSRLLLVAAMGIGSLFVLSQDQDPERKAEWETSKHNNVNTTLAQATVEVRQATAAHCARCHSDQGFRAWLPQLMRGDPGLIKGPDGKDATVAHLTSLGLTRDKVQPITCSTCHNDRGDVRIIHDTYHLPAGFSVNAVGEGALCMTCHNTRNGRITWNAETRPNYSSPHYSAQADMLVGKNFFFLNDTSDTRGSHAFFTGAACTTCHVSMNPQSHTFKAPENVCTNCHGAKMEKDFVQRPTRQLLTRLRTVMSARIMEVRSRIKVVRAYDESKGTYTDNFALDGNKILSLSDVSSVGGQIVFKFRMAEGPDVTTPLGEIREAAGGRQVFALNDPMVRASWNYLMVKYDGSLGIHNPSWTREALQASINAVRAR